jgi:hypothetical protein
VKPIPLYSTIWAVPFTTITCLNLQRHGFCEWQVLWETRFWSDLCYSYWRNNSVWGCPAVKNMYVVLRILVYCLRTNRHNRDELSVDSVSACREIVLRCVTGSGFSLPYTQNSTSELHSNQGSCFPFLDVTSEESPRTHWLILGSASGYEYGGI